MMRQIQSTSMDSNQDNSIDSSEFQKAVSTLSSNTSSDSSSSTSDALDTNKDGAIKKEGTRIITAPQLLSTLVVMLLLMEPMEMQSGVLASKIQKRKHAI